MGLRGMVGTLHMKGSRYPINSTHKSLLLLTLQTELGDDYQLFLLEDAEGKPTAVVLPRKCVLVDPVAFVHFEMGLSQLC